MTITCSGASKVSFQYALSKNKISNSLYTFKNNFSTNYSDKSIIFLRYFFNGELDRGQVLLDDFCKRTSPYSCDVNPTSYDAFQKSVDKLHPFGNYYFDDKGGFFYKG